MYGDRARFPIPCLLLLDLKMPNKNGFDVLSWLRSHAGVHRLPVVVLTTSTDPSDINRAYDLGANSYAVKPAAFDTFIELLNRLECWSIGVNENPLLGQ